MGILGDRLPQESPGGLKFRDPGIGFSTRNLRCRVPGRIKCTKLRCFVIFALLAVLAMIRNVSGPFVVHDHQNGPDRWGDVGWIRFTPLKRMSDGSFHSFERFGPLTRPGALFFSLLRSERRQFFAFSAEHARIPSLWCAKIAIRAEASRKYGNKGKRDLFA